MKDYPKEFTGIGNRKYKLVRVYKHYALYKSEQGWKTCFNRESIRRQLILKRICMGG